MVNFTEALTVETFDTFAALPENADKILEYIAGDVVEVPSNAYVSMLSSRFIGFFFIYLLQHDLGYVTGKAGGYMVSGERYAPDVAFISKARQPELAQEGYNPNPPELAIEIDFPSTYASQEKLRIKIANYLAAGTIVWVVYPHNKRIEVYQPGEPVKILDENGVLEGDPVLPGFRLNVKDIFQS